MLKLRLDMKRTMPRCEALLFGIWAAFSTLASAAEVRPHVEPMAVLKEYGSFVLKRDASFYKFTQDGRFYSAPTNTLIGETLEGTWQVGDSKNEFVVNAKHGYFNGFPGPPEYLRMVFFIPHLYAKPREKGHRARRPMDIQICFADELYEGAFRVQLVEISKEEMNAASRPGTNATSEKSSPPVRRK